MTRPIDAWPRMLNYRPPRIALALLLVAALVQLISPLPALPESVVGGSSIAAMGFLIMLRAWWLFRSRNTAICPTARTTALITYDIYGLTRNPMYLGIVLLLLGLALGTGGLPFYLAALAFLLIMNFVFCAYEEAKLERDFGKEYTYYLGEVRRWL